MLQVQQGEAMPPPFNAPPCRFVLGMRVDLLSHEAAVDQIIALAQGRHAGYCCVTNVHQCVMTHDDPAFRAVVNGATLVVSDSTILRKSVALRYGIDVPPVARGVDLMLALCEAAAERAIPIALIGGKSDSVLEKLTTRLRSQFPGIEIAFAHSPPFRPLTPEETAQQLDGLRASRARLVFVGLGCPKQERWMAAQRSVVDGFMIGVGAAFDFIAGEVKPSPPWVHRVGLEWAYRLASEPRRLWKRYLSTSPRFLALLFADRMRGGDGIRHGEHPL
jgi:N-acetylglucosaminyldiphosphoundecaprenol N-acetyl-beta-D-mannosaminyltransferase